ncbi:hypothetical protein AVEN_176063-1 [Araneus ventricosus]|uniref:Gustatory receptor n=1 Tax=Araneus ventricosus TaxID=182803 RepID=A0A4Y2F6Z0_ARAVE|nr:hypothetical protein AVEN_176063-1 [Araneus ventricosus]
MDFKSTLAYVFANVLSFLLRCSLVYQKRNIRRLVAALNQKKFQLEHRIEEKRIRFSYLILLLIIILPVLLATLYTILSLHEVAELFTYGFEVTTESGQIFVCFFGSYTYYVVFIEYPCIIALSMCLIINRCGILLHQFNLNLKSMKLYDFPIKITALLKDYDLIFDTVRLLKTTLSTPLFFIFLSSFLHLYLTMYNILREYVEPYYMVELIANTCTGLSILISLTLLSSRISEQLHEIRMTSQKLTNLISQHNLRTFCGKRTLFLLERIEARHVIHLSACGMFDLKRSFLLSAFGFLFTYGLLVVNLY